MLAKPTKRFRPDGGFFLGEIGEHVLRIVVKARLTLKSRAAGIEDAATEGSRTAAAEPIQGDHVSAQLSRLQRRTGAGSAEAHNDQIGFVVPPDVVVPGNDQRIGDGREIFSLAHSPANLLQHPHIRQARLSNPCVKAASEPFDG